MDRSTCLIVTSWKQRVPFIPIRFAFSGLEKSALQNLDFVESFHDETFSDNKSTPRTPGRTVA